MSEINIDLNENRGIYVFYIISSQILLILLVMVIFLEKSEGINNAAKCLFYYNTGDFNQAGVSNCQCKQSEVSYLLFFIYTGCNHILFKSVI